jgi:outer membrane immunogenic protein
MRSILLATALLLGGVDAAMAQESHAGDTAVTYHRVRTNAGPGECGCFALNGAAISGSWNFHAGWSAVTEFSAEHIGNAPSTGSSLTLTTFLAGARYTLPQPWPHGAHKPQPFAQVLLGAGHSGGGVAGVGDATYAFAGRIGGGVDVPISSRFSVRAIQVDYFRTQFANGTNDRQNNLLVAFGIAYHWSFRK